MDNFDYKKYLSEGKLLKEEEETKSTSTIYEKEVNGRYGLKYSGKITKGTDADFPYQISVSGGNAEGDNGSFSGFEATEEGAKKMAETKLKELAKYGTFSKEDQMRIKAGLKK